MPAEYVIPYAALLDMLLYNACNKNPSVIVSVESNTGLKYNVNIWGRVKSPAVILHLLCAASAQTILLLLRIKRHFKGSILLLLKLVSVLRANTFNIDPPPQLSLPFLPVRPAVTGSFGRLKILQSDLRRNKPINWGVHILVGRGDWGE